MTQEEEVFMKQCDLYFRSQKNKRRGHDSLVYEANWVALTVRGMDARLDKTLRIRQNYTFLTSTPRWREIMATECEGRKIDHEICDVVIPAAEQILSPYTFNNRKGKGSMAAINQLMEYIYEVTEGYTRPARIIKLDFSGFFPNALWDHAEKCINSVIDTIPAEVLTEEDRDYLRWLTMIAVHSNPAAHCERRTPAYLWKEHIPDEKSILTKPEGTGAAIGRLIWQTAMGLYVNDTIEWLTDERLIRLVVFVDDIVMVVAEEQHWYALSLIPEIRRRLAPRNVRLNEKKFYDQPARHGVEFLGSHLKNGRLHLNNKTYKRAVARIDELNAMSYKDIDTLLSSFNAYSGLLKNRTDYHRLIALRDRVAPEWMKWVKWDGRRLCLTCRDGYTERERLDRKYNLHTKIQKAV